MSNETKQFVRERRYWMAKSKDVEKYLSDDQQIKLSALLTKIAVGRLEDGRPPLEAVCVESDWPEYETVWKMIEDRMTGNHIEDVRGMVPHQPLKPAGEEDKATYKQIADNYTHPANCPRCAELAKAVAFNDETARHYLAGRTEALQKLAALEAKCAELEATNRQLNREVISVGDEAEDYAGKLAVLEAELKERDLQLRHLLCIIHRDGGHHTQAHGLEQSIEDAKEKFFDLRDLPDTIAQQAEQLAAAEKDAERYRWLRSNHPIHDNSPFICRNFGAAFSQWTDDQADKVIDAAIAASKEPK